MLSKYALHPDYADVEDCSIETENALWTHEALKEENESLEPLNQESLEQAGDIHTEVIEIEGYGGKAFRLYLFVPESLAERPSPVIFDIHGGGFVGGIYPH